MNARPARIRTLETLLDEAYLLVLARRPTASALARELGVPNGKLARILQVLSESIRKHGFRVASTGKGKRRVLEIRSLENFAEVAQVNPKTLGARKLPRLRPGLKPEDEIIYARHW
jgi:hypothetical protein